MTPRPPHYRKATSYNLDLLVLFGHHPKQDNERIGW
jgi:hypothetical protein